MSFSAADRLGEHPALQDGSQVVVMDTMPELTPRSSSFGPCVNVPSQILHLQQGRCTIRVWNTYIPSCACPMDVPISWPCLIVPRISSMALPSRKLTGRVTKAASTTLYYSVPFFSMVYIGRRDDRTELLSRCTGIRETETKAKAKRD